MMQIKPVVKPRVLQNQSNGDLEPSLLKPIGDRTSVLAVVADWYKVLQGEFFKARGRHLSFTYGGGYRSWAAQHSLFLSRYEKVSYLTYAVTPADRRKVWPAELGEHRAANPSKSYWRKKVIGTRPDGTKIYPATAAVPGTSNHGVGLAIDLAIGTPQYAQPLNAGDRAWLEANVDRFGFSYESTSEPWHIRYYVGDTCPSFINEKR